MFGIVVKGRHLNPKGFKFWSHSVPLMTLEEGKCKYSN